MSKAEEQKKARVESLFELEGVTFARFKGASLVSAPGTRGFVPLDGARFAEICYGKFGAGISRGSITDLQHAVESTAEDLSGNDRYVGFGEKVWDMKELAFLDDPLSVRPVYSSMIPLCDDKAEIERVKAYFLSLADGDEELAADYPQMVAPMFMYDRPVGVIWALGAGANGKSAFLDSLDLALGKHFSHLTMEMIEDGRATPALRGVLANVNSETSEKRVEDMQKYKNIGAHEPFPVRLLGTHDVVMVDTSFHTIFSANNIPAFGDKTMGSRRRTILVPFPAKFEDDPGFVSRTFTKSFVGAMLTLFLEAAVKVGKEGYSWSRASELLQAQYAKDSNTAEAFGRYIQELGVVAFLNYHKLGMHYETWCGAEGFVALGRTQLKRAMETVFKPVQRIYRDEKNVSVRRYYAPDYGPEDVVWLENGYATAKPSERVLIEQMKLEENDDGGW